MAEKTPENENGLLPFSVIAAAVSGDAEAVCDVVRHYDRYITRLSTEEQTDADGTRRKRVNPDLRNRLVTRLITGILKFRLDGIN